MFERDIFKLQTSFDASSCAEYHRQPHWLAETRFSNFAAFHVLGVHPRGALTTLPDQHVALPDALSSNSSLCDPLQCLRNIDTFRLFLTKVKLGLIFLSLSKKDLPRQSTMFSPCLSKKSSTSCDSWAEFVRRQNKKLRRFESCVIFSIEDMLEFHRKD